MSSNGPHEEDKLFKRSPKKRVKTHRIMSMSNSFNILGQPTTWTAGWATHRTRDTNSAHQHSEQNNIRAIEETAERQNVNGQLNETASKLNKAIKKRKTIFRSRGTLTSDIYQATYPTARTIENARINNYWGDELRDKSEHSFRVYVQNVNGFKLDKQGGQFDSFCKIIKEIQADVTCGQEHNLDTTQSTVRNILFDTVGHHWKRSCLLFGTTRLHYVTLYKPGETFMMTTGNAASCILVHQVPNMWGRCVSQTFKGRLGKRITIDSAYQVFSDYPGQGSATATTQQYGLLIQTADAAKTPRAAF